MEISIILGVLVGIILGLTGAGGGILAVPALIVGMGWSMQQASPVALLAVACGSIIGMISALRKKLVAIKPALIITLMGIPFSALGVRLAQILSGQTLKTIFGIVLLFVGLRSLIKLILKSKNKHQTASKTNELPPSLPASLSIGIMAGFLSGLLGVGGGFIIVPMLQKFSTLSSQKIVATSLMIIALISIGSVSNALFYGVVLPPQESIAFVSAMIIGVLIGRKIIFYLPERTIQLIFSLLLISIGLSFSLSVLN